MGNVGKSEACHVKPTNNASNAGEVAVCVTYSNVYVTYSNVCVTYSNVCVTYSNAGEVAVCVTYRQLARM